MLKRLMMIAGLAAIPVALWASNLPISSLPLGSGSSVGTNDSFPYTNVTAGQPYRLKLDDLVNLPALQTEFNLLAPIASPTFTGTVTIPTLNLVGSSTSGYVWTATDSTGDGSWQAATGGVTAVTATAPLASSGGTTPVISLPSPLPVGNGGLGINTTPSNGYIPIGNGSDYTAAALTAGSGVSITNGSGSISVAETYPLPSPSPSGEFLEANGTGYTLSVPNPYPLPSPSPSGLYIQSNGTGYALAAAANPLPSPSPSGEVLTANGSSWAAAAPYIQAQNQGGGSVYNATLLKAPNFQVTNTSGSTYLIETGNTNLASNASFENGTVTTGWSTGSGVTASAYTSAPVDGAQAIQLSLSSTSSSELLLYNTVTYLSNAAWPVGANAEGSIWVNTTVSGLEVCPVEAGSALTAQCVAIPSGGTWAKVSTNFVFPNTGTSIGVGIYGPSSVSSGTVYADKAYVGIATNLGLGAGMSDWSTTAYSISPSAAFGTPSSVNIEARRSGDTLYVRGSFVSGTPTAGSAGITISGLAIDYTKISANHAVGFANSITNSGTAANIWNVGGNATTLFVDGTTTNEVFFSYQGQSAVYAKSTGSGVAIAGYLMPFEFSVPIVGWTSNQAGYRADQTPASWSGYHNSTCSWSRSATTYADYGSGSASGCALVQSLNRNFGTVTGYGASSGTSALPGITFTPPRSGRYWVCATFENGNSSSDYAAYQLTDGTNVLDQSEVYSQSGINTTQLCGIDDLSGSTSTSIRIQGKSNAGSTYLEIASVGGAVITWKVIELDAPMPAPYLVGSVTSTTSGQEHIERATIAGGNPPTISSQSSSWLTYSSRSSAGDYVYNFTAGEWSGAPSCVCTAVASSSHYVCSVSVTSNTSMEFNLYTIGGTAADTTIGVICMGPR